MKPSKKTIVLKTLFVALIVAGVAVGVFFLLRYLGFTDEERLKEFMSYYGVYFWVIVETINSFIPFLNLAQHHNIQLLLMRQVANGN